MKAASSSLHQLEGGQILDNMNSVAFDIINSRSRVCLCGSGIGDLNLVLIFRSTRHGSVSSETGETVNSESDVLVEDLLAGDSATRGREFLRLIKERMRERRRRREREGASAEKTLRNHIYISVLLCDSCTHSERGSRVAGVGERE